MTIGFNLGHDLDLEFSKSNMEFAISQSKMVTKRKANISIEIHACNVTIRFDLGHDLDLELSRSNMTLTFDNTHGLDQGFSWSKFEIAVSQNLRAD